MPPNAPDKIVRVSDGEWRVALRWSREALAVRAEEGEQSGQTKLTRKEVLEMQRAIALFNSYSFGYMLGMNFRNREGKHEMLWPRDLDEILKDGQTKRGCRVH